MPISLTFSRKWSFDYYTVILYLLTLYSKLVNIMGNSNNLYLDPEFKTKYDELQEKFRA